MTPLAHIATVGGMGYIANIGWHECSKVPNNLQQLTHTFEERGRRDEEGGEVREGGGRRQEAGGIKESV